MRTLGLALMGTVLAVLATMRPGDAQLIRTGRPAPELTGESWINSERLSLKDLRGRVVLVEFWTYG